MCLSNFSYEWLEFLENKNMKPNFAAAASIFLPTGKSSIESVTQVIFQIY